MKTDTNEFMPHPQEKDERYGSFCHRLEEGVIKIATLEVPTEEAIKALACIAMEAPSDWSSIREVQPFRRTREFLARCPEDLRTLFAKESMALSRGRRDRVGTFLYTCVRLSPYQILLAQSGKFS